MNIDKIKLDLVKLIKHKTGVSFVEIENYFDEIGFKTCTQNDRNGRNNK